MNQNHDTENGSEGARVDPFAPEAPSHVFLAALLDVVVSASTHYLGMSECGVTPERLSATMADLRRHVEAAEVIYRATCGADGLCAVCGDFIGGDGVGDWNRYCADCADSADSTDGGNPFGDALNR